MASSSTRADRPLFVPDENGQPFHIRIVALISGKPEEVDIENLATQELQRMKVNQVLGDELRNAYANDAYVGKCFEIRKYAPQNGKRYATFQIDEIEIEDEPSGIKVTEKYQPWVPEETRRRIDEFFERAEAQLKASSEATLTKAVNQSECWWKPPEGETRQSWYYRVYLHSKQWKMIPRRVHKQDGKLCRRCGGGASGADKATHHISYSDEVMRGEADDQIVCICKGCHRFIHFDDEGKKRSGDEVKRFLLDKSECVAVVPLDIADIDLRLRSMIRPWNWDHSELQVNIAKSCGFITGWMILPLIWR
jgi:5-methylcytosine-specific restriction endonuclease McrA